MPLSSLGERELDVMMVLWDVGAAPVSTVRHRLAAPLAYTTVLTVLRNLETKGYVAHTSAGRSHVFTPCVKRESVQRAALERVLNRYFARSPAALTRMLRRIRSLV